MSKALLISNRNSRRGGSHLIADAIKLLRKDGLEVLHIESESIEQTEREILSRKPAIDIVIGAGGDGTISSMANAIHKTQLPLAILPLGTANDLARSLSIPEDIESACLAITQGQRRRIDLGIVNGKLFFNVVNIGLGTQITKGLDSQTKRVLGPFSYLKVLLSKLSNAKRFSAQLLVDGYQKKIKSVHIGIGNGRYYGGGNVVSDDCEIDDGLLSLYSIKPQIFWELIGLAPLIRWGKHQSSERVYSSKGKRIQLLTNPSSMEIHADGEFVSFTPARISVLPSAITIFTPDKQKGPLALISKEFTR